MFDTYEEPHSYCRLAPCQDCVAEHAALFAEETQYAKMEELGGDSRKFIGSGEDVVLDGNHNVTLEMFS